MSTERLIAHIQTLDRALAGELPPAEQRNLQRLRADLKRLLDQRLRAAQL